MDTTHSPLAPIEMPQGAATEASLLGEPDWFYLTREFEALYAFGSSGGSKAIRKHRRRVRDALGEVLRSDPPVAPRPPETKPVTAHLSRALDLGERAALGSMARAVREVRARLTWEYGYERMPEALARNYAYCEVLGPRGPIRCDDLILGFVLFAPGATYPQHSHHDIEESYVSVAGGWSENNAAVYAPGSLILNRAGQKHRITTDRADPCLLAYAWVGSREALADPGMELPCMG